MPALDWVGVLGPRFLLTQSQLLTAAGRQQLLIDSAEAMEDVIAHGIPA